MKPKTKAMLDELIKDPKISQQEAYLRTHETTNKATARVNASQLINKPAAQIYLKKHEDRAKQVIVEIMDNSRILKDEPAHSQIALKAAESILDRNLGRPISRTNNLNLDITLEEALNSLQ